MLNLLLKDGQMDAKSQCPGDPRCLSLAMATLMVRDWAADTNPPTANG